MIMSRTALGVVALTSCLALSALTTTAEAAVVRVWGEDRGSNKVNINNFYAGLPGHSSAIVGGTLDTVDLTGVRLLWATQPGDSYTAAELASMASFLSLGGRIAFLGEHGGFAPGENIRINAALASLGADITITNNALSCGFRSAKRSEGEILDHPLTVGVDNYEYACFAQLNISGTAQSLMLGDTGSDGEGITMMAYQNIGPGSVFLITDQNVWDHASTGWPGGVPPFNNARMFENLLIGDTGAPPPPGIPEPGTLALLGLGLTGVFLRRKLRL